MIDLLSCTSPRKRKLSSHTNKPFMKAVLMFTTVFLRILKHWASQNFPQRNEEQHKNKVNKNNYFYFSPILSYSECNSKDIFSAIGQKQRLLLHCMMKRHASKQIWQIIPNSRLIAQLYSTPSGCFCDSTNIPAHHNTLWACQMSSLYNTYCKLFHF